MAASALVDREYLERLERLTLQWQKSFNGLVGGRKASRAAGAGHEFLDHRNFHPGDDYRSVNWRAYMRFERFFLKTFQAEPHVPVRLLLDTSASMGLVPAKFDYVRKLAASLVYVALVRLDSVTIQPFSAGLGQRYLASGGRHRFEPVAAYLEALCCEGRTDFEKLARNYLNRYPQRGLTVVLSDFLSADDCLRPLQWIADAGHELLLVQVWHSEDRAPMVRGRLQISDVESNAKRELTVDDAAIRAYTERFDEYARTLERLALRNEGRYAGLSSDVPLEEALFGALAMAHSGA